MNNLLDFRLRSSCFPGEQGFMEWSSVYAVEIFRVFPDKIDLSFSGEDLS